MREELLQQFLGHEAPETTQRYYKPRRVTSKAPFRVVPGLEGPRVGPSPTLASEFSRHQPVSGATIFTEGLDTEGSLLLNKLNSAIPTRGRPKSNSEPHPQFERHRRNDPSGARPTSVVFFSRCPHHHLF